MSTQGRPNPAPRQGLSAAALGDHLANERTLLDRHRIALGVKVIGCLIDRFAFSWSGSTWLAAKIGVLLTVSGALVSGIGARRFLGTKREIEAQTYGRRSWRTWC